MRPFYNLLRHEIRILFLSPATYIAGVLFLVLMGLMYVFILEGFSETAHEDLPSTEFFRAFWIPVFFMVPLLTMKSLAEERRLGTLETLMTTPVNAFSIVLSKFISAYLLYILLWGITLGFPLVVKSLLPALAVTQSLTDHASLFGGYTFIALSGILYIAIGIFTSSLTRSQLIAGMLAFSLLFFVIVGGRLLLEVPLTDFTWFQWVKMPLEYLQTFQHLEDFSRGILDSRPFILYISNALIVLGVTSLIVEAKA